ncbi:hypothetical protein GOEFS_115_00520 [Gordonia effusa NBRC 100432]|uniref:Uncharacterized protein n=1 Tax=Gordonia effusa NBRC 100432 TaxID=1077974 RepID=H0R5R1_9ACTN|nr:hypothetical protein [Gordonia effusa]GAB20412.1 hypothetical protein GOEFS_115_00520 [Gordonia effusa NBRC 100432]
MASRWAGTVAIAAVAVVLSACGPAATETRTTVTKTVVAPASSTSTSSMSARSVAGAAELRRGWKALSRSLSQPVSVSIVGVGASSWQRINLGTLGTQVAWSTIKVPLAIAAERKDGPMTATSAAITQSDNASAEALWASLGGGSRASEAVMAVLRQAGSNAQVPSRRLLAGFTVFGQTPWPTSDAAIFAANLPCLPDANRVLGYMGNVAGNQQWGAQIMAAPTSTAVKGGWGPSPASGYVVRQIAILTFGGGVKTAIAMTTAASGGSLESGISTLNQVARWLNTKVEQLPGGTCSR